MKRNGRKSQLGSALPSRVFSLCHYAQLCSMDCSNSVKQQPVEVAVAVFDLGAAVDPPPTSWKTCEAAWQ